MKRVAVARMQGYEPVKPHDHSSIERGEAWILN